MLKFFNTIKFLKLNQIIYRIYYGIRNRLYKKKYNKKNFGGTNKLKIEYYIKKNNSYLNSNQFIFLNIKYKFQKKIDWNIKLHGKLWCYNLNYFDFLNQNKIKTKSGLYLINDYIENENLLIDGNEPYPISLRCVNWIKFVCRNKIDDIRINNSIYNQYLRLIDNIEYNILGNHLLENAFSLLFGSYYFNSIIFYKKGVSILKKELNEQILDDGSHFELSTMYHLIILDRLLDSICLIRSNNKIFNDNDFLVFLTTKATMMLSWIKNISFKDYSVPNLNDSIEGISPDLNKIEDYSNFLRINNTELALGDSGYRKIESKIFELIFDIGKIGPDYQPGHAHADTFNFLLSVNNKKIIVDPGISTYENNNLRHLQRSTKFHNTVSVLNQNSSDIWHTFRVANRAEVKIIKDEENFITASHNGFSNFGIIHERSIVKIDSNEIEIFDKLNLNHDATAYFYLHNNVNVEIVNQKNRVLINTNITINFENCNNIKIKNFDLPVGFNKSIKSKKLIVKFNEFLKSRIIIR